MNKRCINKSSENRTEKNKKIKLEHRVKKKINNGEITVFWNLMYLKGSKTSAALRSTKAALCLPSAFLEVALLIRDFTCVGSMLRALDASDCNIRRDKRGNIQSNEGA